MLTLKNIRIMDTSENILEILSKVSRLNWKVTRSQIDFC